MNGWMLADDARIVRAVLSITAPARSSVPFLSARWLHRRPTPGAAALDAPLAVPRAGVVQALRQAKQAECCSYNAGRFGLGVGLETQAFELRTRAADRAATRAERLQSAASSRLISSRSLAAPRFASSPAFFRILTPAAATRTSLPLRALLPSQRRPAPAATPLAGRRPAGQGLQTSQHVPCCPALRCPPARLPACAPARSRELSFVTGLQQHRDPLRASWHEPEHARKLARFGRLCAGAFSCDSSSLCSPAMTRIVNTTRCLPTEPGPRAARCGRRHHASRLFGPPQLLFCTQPHRNRLSPAEVTAERRH